MPNLVKQFHPNSKCLKAHDFQRLLAGFSGAAELAHLYSCSQCRAVITVAAELGEHRAHALSAATRLAASSHNGGASLLLRTADDSLTCDLVDIGTPMQSITIVADPAVWGDCVVLWPGAFEPVLLPVGSALQDLPDSRAPIESWSISPAEAMFDLSANQSQELVSQYTRIDILSDAHGFRLDWATQAASLAAHRDRNGKWVETSLPSHMSELPSVLKVFTPFTAEPLLR